MKVSWRDRGSESSVGIGCRCGVVLGCKLLCRKEYPAKRGRRVVQGSLVQVQMMRCYIDADARVGVLVTGGMVQRRCRLGLVSVESVVYTSRTAMLPTYLCISAQVSTL